MFNNRNILYLGAQNRKKEEWMNGRRGHDRRKQYNKN